MLFVRRCILEDVIDDMKKWLGWKDADCQNFSDSEEWRTNCKSLYKGARSPFSIQGPFARTLARMYLILLH